MTYFRADGVIATCVVGRDCCVILGIAIYSCHEQRATDLPVFCPRHRLSAATSPWGSIHTDRVQHSIRNAFNPCYFYHFYISLFLSQLSWILLFQNLGHGTNLWDHRCKSMRKSDNWPINACGTTKYFKWLWLSVCLTHAHCFSLELIVLLSSGYFAPVTERK